MGAVYKPDELKKNKPAHPVVRMLEQIAGLPLAGLVAVFLSAAGLVWFAGTRLTHAVDRIARRFDLGQAFAGMVLLGGITSLPELAAVTTSSATGDASLAVNNLLGSAAVNVLLLVLADIVFGRDALTGVIGKPATLMQGVLGMMLLALVAVIVLAGDVDAGGVGAGSVFVLAVSLLMLRLSSRYERRDVWRPVEEADGEEPQAEDDDGSSLRLLGGVALLGGAILVGGALLSLTAEGIASQTGLSTGLVGFLLVAVATSLPELSSVTEAVRAKRYELAIGDIFGTNLFNLSLLAVADLASPDGPVLASTGPFEVIGALTALLMTGAFVVGLLERRDRTLLRMGYDSVAVIAIFAAGVSAMAMVMPAG